MASALITQLFVFDHTALWGKEREGEERGGEGKKREVRPFIHSAGARPTAGEKG